MKEEGALKSRSTCIKKKSVWIKKKKPGLSMKKYEGGRVQEPQHLRISKKKKAPVDLKKKKPTLSKKEGAFKSRSTSKAVAKQ